MLNMERISELKDDFGEEDFYEVVTLFLSEVEASFETLLAGNFDSLGDELHALKGSAANLGFETLFQACETAEKNSSEADLAGLQKIFNASRAQFMAEV